MGSAPSSSGSDARQLVGLRCAAQVVLGILAGVVYGEPSNQKSRTRRTLFSQVRTRRPPGTGLTTLQKEIRELQTGALVVNSSL